MKRKIKYLIHSINVLIIIWIMGQIPLELDGTDNFDLSYGVLPNGYRICDEPEYHALSSTFSGASFPEVVRQFNVGFDDEKKHINGQLVGYSFNLHQIVFRIENEDGGSCWIEPLPFRRGQDYQFVYIGETLGEEWSNMITINLQGKFFIFMNSFFFGCGLLLFILYPIFLVVRFRKREIFTSDDKLRKLCYPIYFLPLYDFALHCLSSLFMSLLRVLF